MPPATRRLFLLGTAALCATPALAQPRREDLDVPYVPTPPEVVEGMLDLADLKPGERLIDLGSGDGRIPIAAARRGASALGIEINSRLVSRARYLAALASVADRARFERADLFTVPLRDADVVTLYLLPDVNRRLRSKLLVELRPGARVVSHAFDMEDWVPDISRSIAERRVYLWTIPAVAGGRWRLTRADGTGALLEIQQRYNRVAGTLGGRAMTRARLHGPAIDFVVDGVRYRGTVGERRIESVADATPAWHAERTE
jgi:SAM-dependent methyltransferase